MLWLHTALTFQSTRCTTSSQHKPCPEKEIMYFTLMRHALHIAQHPKGTEVHERSHTAVQGGRTNADIAICLTGSHSKHLLKGFGGCVCIHHALMITIISVRPGLCECLHPNLCVDLLRLVQISNGIRNSNAYIQNLVHTAAHP